MKSRTALAVALASLLAACTTPATTDAVESAAVPALPAGLHVGEPVEPRPIHAYADVIAAPQQHLDQTLLVAATVTAVCQKAGCWMQIEDEGHTALVRWETGCGGAYVFPTDATGKRVVIQGSFYPKELSPEDAEHMRAEAGHDVEIPARTYELNASAVLVVDSAAASS